MKCNIVIVTLTIVLKWMRRDENDQQQQNEKEIKQSTEAY